MAYGDKVKNKQNTTQTKYTIDELRAFDKELEPYKTKNNVGNIELTYDGMVKYMVDKKVIHLTEYGYSVVCEIDNGKPNCTRFMIIDEKFSQLLDYYGRRNYAKKKELEELEAPSKSV